MYIYYMYFIDLWSYLVKIVITKKSYFWWLCLLHFQICKVTEIVTSITNPDSDDRAVCVETIYDDIWSSDKQTKAITLATPPVLAMHTYFY